MSGELSAHAHPLARHLACRRCWIKTQSTGGRAPACPACPLSSSSDPRPWLRKANRGGVLGIVTSLGQCFTPQCTHLALNYRLQLRRTPAQLKPPPDPAAFPTHQRPSACTTGTLYCESHLSPPHLTPPPTGGHTASFSVRPSSQTTWGKLSGLLIPRVRSRSISGHREWKGGPVRMEKGSWGGLAPAQQGSVRWLSNRWGGDFKAARALGFRSIFPLVAGGLGPTDGCHSREAPSQDEDEAALSSERHT